MRIAVEGCCHGELDKIYDTVIELEKQNGFKIDLLIICGDFQAVRNFDDLQAMAVPPKYQQLNTFYKYYSHEKVAPVLTVFIGGNHEASNYMQELPYGGWVAPNIYYMGYAGIIQIGGIRIGGISGIFKGHDFNKGHFERPPYADDAKRSVYHVRNLEVFRLKQMTRPVDIFISHDWPRGIYHYGNVESLIKKKPFFQREIEENKLGSGPLSGLLSHLQPGHWFAAHLHVKFAAHVQHQAKSEQEPARCTKFLALDKCLPRRNFLQVLELPHEQKEGFKIKLDPEWLAILQKTDHLLNLTSSNIYMPGPGCGQRFDFQVTDKEIEDMVKTFGGDMTLPENFVHTSPPIMGNPDVAARQRKQPLSVQVNPQTTLLCTMLVITDPNAKFIGRTSQELLDDSSVGLDVDSGNDVSEEDADSELPSTIDSTLDVSASPGSTSLKWDSFCERNISVHRSQTLPLGRSTPAKNSLSSTPVSFQVDDNDDEFLSIMSAQKTKMSDVSSRHLSPSFLDANRHSPSSPHKDGIDNIVHSNQLRVDQASGEVCSDTAMKTEISCERVHATLPCQLSASNSNESTNVSSCDNQQPSLNLKRTSLGMSGLCLHSAETSPSLSKTGDSFSQSETEDVSVAPENGSSVKKLKRRNVSLYSEPLL